MRDIPEASIDLAKLAGLYPAAALMEVMNEDGTMARLPELRQMADQYGFKLILDCRLDSLSFEARVRW